jgi:regulator of CtrA degradation
LGDVVHRVIDSAYDEAMALLMVARDQAARGPVGAKATAIGIRPALLQVGRSFRITARLGHVLAWILARRALHAGEITEAEARSEHFRLACQETCLATDDDDDMASASLRRLSLQSLFLYRRIARLDSLIDQAEPAAPA